MSVYFDAVHHPYCCGWGRGVPRICVPTRIIAGGAAAWHYHAFVFVGPERGVFVLPLRPLLTAARLCALDEPSVLHAGVAGLAAVPCHLLAAGVVVSTDGHARDTFVCAAAEDRIR